jgi:alpha-D-xyloside xylohydrolase
MPVLVREGAVLPRVPVDESVRAVQDLRDRPWELHVYGDVDLDGPEFIDFNGQQLRAALLRTVLH